MKKFIFLFIFLTGSLFVSAQKSYTFNWVKTTVSPGNNLLQMNVYKDNTAVIAGLKGTFKKSDSNGLVWNSIPLLKGAYNFVDISLDTNGIGYACSGKAKSVNNPSKGDPDVYVAGDLLKTTDNGETWELLNPKVMGAGDDPALNPNAPGCYSLSYYSVESVNDSTALAGVAWYDMNSGKKVTHSAVFKTTDGGTTWKAITKDRGYSYPMCIVSADTSTYMGGNKFLLKTVVGSDSVIDIYPNLAAANTDSSLFIYNVTAVSEKEVYVTTTSDGVFKTMDGGATFEKLNGPKGGFDFYKVNDSTFLVLGTSTRSKLSTDGGNTWIAFYPGSTCYAIGGILNDSLYGLGRSSIHKIALADMASHTNTWVSTTLSSGNNLRRMAVVNDNKAFIVGYGDTFKTTGDKGVNWTDAQLPELFQYGAKFDFNGVSSNNGASYVCLRRFKEIDYPYSSGKADIYINGLIFKSFDEWKTWTLLDLSKLDNGGDHTANPYAPDCYGVDPVAIECVDSTTAYVFVDWDDTTTGKKVWHSRVFKTSDGGNSWDTITKDFGSSYVTDIHYVNDSLLYILGNKIFLKSTDGGTTMTDLYPTLAVGTDSSMYLKSMNYVNNKVFYIVTLSDGIFKTTDGGETYTQLNGKTGAYALYIVDSTTYITAGSKTKTLFSHDKGKTWVSCSPGATLWNFGGVQNDSLVGLARSDIYKIALTDLLPTTGIQNIEPDNPVKVAYGQNNIKILSPDANIDKCTVYSISGRIIMVMEPNAKSCVINSRTFAPGIYIISTSIANKRYVNKVIFR
jgi:photosystem II stability/assembly factor-like uncharacterized protein